MTRMIVTSRLTMCREAAGSRSSCRRLGRRYTELCPGGSIPERVSLVSTAHVARARPPFGAGETFG